MNDKLPRQQRRMSRMLLLHLLAIIVIPVLFPIFGNGWDNVIVAALGVVVLGLIDRRYGRYLLWSTLFLVYVIKEIIVSNLVLAWLIIQPKPKLDPGIIGVPLTVNTALEITVLSLAIAATPGTLVVELGRNDAGDNVLYVHTLNVGDPEQFRASIKSGFEQMILKISRGATA
jgi:multicomponent Na+:H+ antiporter subunit E